MVVIQELFDLFGRRNKKKYKCILNNIYEYKVIGQQRHKTHPRS